MIPHRILRLLEISCVPGVGELLGLAAELLHRVACLASVGGLDGGGLPLDIDAGVAPRAARSLVAGAVDPPLSALVGLLAVVAVGRGAPFTDTVGRRGELVRP